MSRNTQMSVSKRRLTNLANVACIPYWDGKIAADRQKVFVDSAIFILAFMSMALSTFLGNVLHSMNVRGQLQNTPHDSEFASLTRKDCPHVLRCCTLLG